MVLQKSWVLERSLLTATLLAVCVGGVVAWATTGVFSVVAFVIVTVLGLAVQLGLYRLKPYLPWIFAPLLVMVVYRTQAGRLAWAAMWPTFILTAVWLPYLGVGAADRATTAARLGNRGYVAAYVLLLIGVAVGGIPVWSLLCWLPAPLAWRVYKSADVALFEEGAIVTGMFLVAGYVIKGLIR